MLPLLLSHTLCLFCLLKEIDWAKEEDLPSKCKKEHHEEDYFGNYSHEMTANHCNFPCQLYNRKCSICRFKITNNKTYDKNTEFKVTNQPIGAVHQCTKCVKEWMNWENNGREGRRPAIYLLCAKCFAEETKSKKEEEPLRKKRRIEV